jgi:hypothetical protein
MANAEDESGWLSGDEVELDEETLVRKARPSVLSVPIGGAGDVECGPTATIDTCDILSAQAIDRMKAAMLSIGTCSSKLGNTFSGVSCLVRVDACVIHTLPWRQRKYSPGAQATTWLSDRFKPTSREEAVQLAQRLMDHTVICEVSKSDDIFRVCRVVATESVGSSLAGAMHERVTGGGGGGGGCDWWLWVWLWYRTRIRPIIVSSMTHQSHTKSVAAAATAAFDVLAIPATLQR